MCVCVCACERERERYRGTKRQGKGPGNRKDRTSRNKVLKTCRGEARRDEL
jgi:hypothetical protein